MHCFLCFNSEDKLHRFQGETVNDIIKKIKFVLPNRLMPDSKDSIIICATCMEEVSSFYTIKKESLQNCCHLKQFKAMLKGTNNFKFNELKIKINNDEISVQHEHLTEFEVNSKSKYSLSSNKQNVTHIKEENKEYDDYSQELVNDESSLNHLQDNESSCSNNNSTQHHVNVGDYEFVDVNNQVIIKREKLSPHHEQINEFIDNSSSKYLLSSKDQNPTHIKEGIKEYDQYGQNFLNDELSSNHIQNDDSSRSSNDNTQKQKNLHMEKVIETDFHLKSNNSRQKDQPKTQREIKKKKFKCPECHKAFITPSNLQQHIRVHTGERPYTCATCQKTFTQLSSLKTHKLIHTGKKPHECDICHKTFKQKTDLISHKRIHNNVRPFQCAVCSKAFRHSSSLTRHKLTHTGEKPHQCHLCQYKCKSAGDLKTHIRRHTGEKPYNCQHCKKSFTTTGDIKRHRHRLHSNEDS